MGLGDEIMATGQARVAQRTDPRPVAVLDKHGRPRWHPVWEGNPRIARPAAVAHGLDVQTVVSGAGCRPYVARYTEERWFYTDWRAPRGEIYLSDGERAFGRHGAGAIVVEPHTKAKASPNKQWPWERWQRVVDLRPDLPWLQLGPPGTRPLNGVRFLATPDFRHACAALSWARAAVLPEGGLHHAAAAFRLPAVVIFGGMIAPRNTGYPGHINVYRPHDGSPCGMRVPCRGCRDSLASIAPEEVVDELEGLLCSSAKA